MKGRESEIGERRDSPGFFFVKAKRPPPNRRGPETEPEAKRMRRKNQEATREKPEERESVCVVVSL